MYVMDGTWQKVNNMTYRSYWSHRVVQRFTHCRTQCGMDFGTVMRTSTSSKVHFEDLKRGRHEDIPLTPQWFRKALPESHKSRKDWEQ